MESKNMTPASSSRKRRSTANAMSSDTEQTPTKQRQTSAKRAKGKLQEDTMRINLDDSEDPFDFSQNSDLHPEPLKNINIEHSSFGEVKYTKSLPTSTDHYKNTETIAISRSPKLNISTAPDNPTSLSMLSGGNIRMELSFNEMNNYDKQARKKLDQKNVTKEGGSIDEFQIEIGNDDGNETLKRKKRSSAAMKSQSPKNLSRTAETPKSAHAKNKSDYWPAATVDTTKSLKEIEHYQIPELNPHEQLSIDHPKELNQLLQPGARVLALWGNEYYAAIVCGREALGRYYIHFTEDNLNRILPPTGVIPISSLQQGIKISYIDVVDNEEVGKVSELMSQPEMDLDNPKNWVQGLFQLRELDEDLNPGEIKSIHWQKLFLTKEQAGQIFHSKKSNPIIKIDEENIINESRATRRSRSSKINQGSGLQTPTANSITPKNFGSSGRGRRRNTTKEVTIEEIISMGNIEPNIESSNIINKKEKVIPISALSMNGSGNDSSISGHEKKELATTKSNNTNSDTNSSEDHDKNIFTGLKFVLTSANRPNKKSEFNKREIRVKIEERGGIVVDDFSSLEPGESTNFRLIADTFYRTHKYLLALSLSIPCVDYHWVEFCVTQNKKEPIDNFLLPSGESTIEPGRIFPWQPKSNLFASKRVLVYSKYNSDDPKIYSFSDIWSPIMKNLGATVIGSGSGEPFSKEAAKVATIEEKIEFCNHIENKFDIFLADNDVETELVETAEKNFGALAVSSEWIIQAIVTGELPNVDSSERFKYDFA